MFVDEVHRFSKAQQDALLPGVENRWVTLVAATTENPFFSVMGLGEDEAQEKFGFLLDAFKFGAPPHGGIAVGMDRIVALLAGTDSIRDVIAFPKSGGGYDPLTAAPAPITPEQRKEAGVDAAPAKDVPPVE